MSSLFTAFMITFLVIFVFTAILTLAALPGWIKLPDHYTRKLFTSLILEVVGCVIGFVSVGIRISNTKPAPELTEEMLVNTQKWFWQYAKASLSTEGHFSKEGDHLSFSATSFYRHHVPHRTNDDSASEDMDQPVIVWHSLKPIRLEKGRITFLCEKEILPTMRAIDGHSQLPGKYTTMLTLSAMVVPSGGYCPPDTLAANPDTTSVGGILFAPTE